MDQWIPSLEQAFKRFVQSAEYRPMTAREIGSRMGLSPDMRAALRALLRQMERDGQIVRLRGQRWARPQNLDQCVGLLQVNRRGDANVVDELRPDRIVRIPPEALSGAVHGDRVLVQVRPKGALLASREGGRRFVRPTLVGRIVRVVERSRPVTTGVLRKGPHYWYAVPLDPRFPTNVWIANWEQRLHEPPAEGAVVAIELEPWRAGDTRCRGRITEVLGPKADLGVRLRALIRDAGFPERHSGEAIREGRRHLRSSSFSFDGRRDHRDWPAVTIDPPDARDFDDAVSIRRLDAHHWEVGVHIADVSSYVAPDSAMDREARERGTSVYLPGRALTMLPPELTTEVCSLSPETDRPCLTVRAVLDDQAHLLSADIYPSVIRSRARLDYESVQAWLVDERADAVPGHIRQLLCELEQVAAALRRRRAAAGALLFTLPEVWCQTDDAGRALAFHRREAHLAYALIEELMLLANMVVARRLASARVPAIYRIHAPPDVEQWERMEAALLELGVRMPSADRQGAIAVLRAVEGTVREYPVAMTVLRHLKRAEYSTRCGVHFGLAARPYTHFTSPIRRYPDLVVHRIVRALASGEPPPHSHSATAEIARHATRQEQLAEEVERDSLELLRLDYYQRCLQRGETGPWPAVVVQQLSTGWIVELTDTLQSALIREEVTGRALHPGMRLDVELLRVDERRRLLEVRPAAAAPLRPRQGQRIR
ncbi:MAG: RNB domain-containing ribonuclease [Kiritimatiellae bacterium]|nr:RNB domain-containing ribonuclease [Kiritimatiellia bacterium]